MSTTTQFDPTTDSNRVGPRRAILRLAKSAVVTSLAAALVSSFAGSAQAAGFTSYAGQIGSIRLVNKVQVDVRAGSYVANLYPGKLTIGAATAYPYSQWICVRAYVQFRSGTVTGTGWGSMTVLDRPSECTFINRSQSSGETTALPAITWSLTTGNFVHVKYLVQWYDYYGTTRLGWAYYEDTAAGDYACTVPYAYGTTCSVTNQYGVSGIFMQ